MNNRNNKMNRRSVVKQGAALLGAGLTGSMTKASAVPAEDSEDHIFNVMSYGATGRRQDNATGSLKAAIEACSRSGGGRVLVPPGDYTVGTVVLLDHVNLHVDAGATLYLSQDKDDFIEGGRTMIFAENASRISVTGKGTLDGMASYEFTEMHGIDPEIADEIRIARKAGVDMRRYYRTGMQTFMFILNDCTSVLIQDISVIHSPLWNIRLNDCDRVFIRGIYVYSDLEKGVNADGIDICCSRNVTISDSVIITADDAIVLKTPLHRGKEIAGPTENIVVTNCVLTSSSTPLMIGTETMADIRHVIFSNCTIRNSNKGFGINVQDGATVSDVIFSNLTVETNRRHWNWWGSAELVKFVLKKREESSPLGLIRDILIENIVSHVRGTSLIRGHPDRHLENIRMHNVQIYMDPEDYKDKRATDVLAIENVKELEIRDLSVRWNESETEKKWESALVLKKVDGFGIRNFSGRQGLTGNIAPAILLENVSEGLIADSRALEGCQEFIRIRGDETKDIILRDNRTSKAVKDVGYESADLRKAVKIL